MTLMRSALLRGSRSPWLARRARRSRLVRRAVQRFVPGETLDDAMRAAAALQVAGLPTVLTRLGEEVTTTAQTIHTVDHYMSVLDHIDREGLDCQISVKPSQLGLAMSDGLCFRNLRAIVDRAARSERFVTVDMESTRYTDATIELYRGVRREYANVGICLQSYLYRTAGDLESLLPLGPTVRLVKGAYDEPRELAFSRKREVDENFLALVRRLSSADARKAGGRIVLGTHDLPLVERAMRHATSAGVLPDGIEVHMLYGIQREAQRRLAREGACVRVLISYGEAWFAWYMRRVAERPANLLFVFQQVVGG